MATILIIEDQPDVRENIEAILELEDYQTLTAADGVIGVQLAQQYLPDLILCDVMMPRLDGFGVLQTLREQPTTQSIPLIFLTAKADKEAVRQGMGLGADDYLVKPFSPAELVARVRALLRRSLRHEEQRRIYQTPHFCLDPDRHTATRHWNNENEILNLTTIEFTLLETFLSYPGRVWSRSLLIEKLWGNDFYGEDRVVDTHIARLRKKIEPESSQPRFVKTVVGIGYKFEDDPD